MKNITVRNLFGIGFLIFILLLSSCASWGNNVKAPTVEEIQAAFDDAGPGSRIILASGVYTDAVLTINANGTEDAPILISAEEGGKVIMTGNSRLRIGGDYVRVDGLYYTDGFLGPQDGGVIEFRSQDPDTEVYNYAHHSTVANTVVAYYNNPDRKIDYKWFSLYGTYNTVEYCEIIGKNHSGTSMAVWRDDDSPQYHTIRRNKFMYIEDDEDGNGAEALRVGTSQQSLSDSFTLVEENYFEQCNGEIEIISSKSGSNTYRNNTFVDNAGMLTLRHGDNCEVTGNVFLGNGYYGSGGIRVIGENHIVTGNYIEGTYGDGGTFRSAICLTNGRESTPLNGYFQVKNAYVADNILVNNRRNFIVGGGAAKNLTLPPVDCTIENNTIYNEGKTNLFTNYAEPINLTLNNNRTVESGDTPGRPDYITADEAGALWARGLTGADDKSFRKRNLYEEAFEKRVVLPWSDLTKWSGEKGIIVMGAESYYAYIDTTRYKYDILDNSVNPYFEGETFMIPRAFVEKQLGPSKGLSDKDYISLEELGTAYGYHTLTHEYGFALMVKDKEYFDLLAIPATLKKMGDLYKVIGSDDDGNLPANTMDGILTTRWSADGDGQWLRYNLQEERTVSSAEIAFYKGDERSTAFEIQISSDSYNWTTLYEGRSSGTGTAPEKFAFPEATGSYMRIVGHMNSSNTWNSISEVQFYGPDGKSLMENLKVKGEVYVEQVAVAPPVTVQLEGTPYSPTDDAYIEMGSPDTTFGINDGDKLRIKAKADYSIVRISYVKFDISDAAEVNKAMFQITGKVSTNNPPNPRMEFDVYGIEDDNWEEESITWNNSPSHALDTTEVTGLEESAFHLGSFEFYGAGVKQTVAVDVTEFVQKQKGKDGIVTLMLVDSKIQNTNSDPYSKERSTEADRPYLYIK